MRDTIILGLLGGLIGNITKDISNYLIYRAGKTEMLYGHYAASMISEPEEVHEKKHFALGQLVDTVVGAAMGIPLAYVFRRTGRDYHLIKGAGLGLLLWGLLYSVGPNLGILSIKPRATKTHFSALWNNFLYGVTTALAIGALAGPGVFTDKQKKEEVISESRPRPL